MSSRRSKKSALNRYPTIRSEWERNEQYDCYPQYPEKGKDDWEFEYGPVLADSEGAVTMSTESAYLDPSGMPLHIEQNLGDISHLDYQVDVNPADVAQNDIFDTEDTLQQGESAGNDMADITNRTSQTTLSSEPAPYPHDHYYQDQGPPSSSQPVYAQQPYDPSRRNKLKTIGARDSLNKHKDLDYRYKVYKSSEFQPGRVFELPWDGPNSNSGSKGSMLESDDDITDSEILGRSSSRVAKVRKFVIVDSRQYKGHSICLPIKTYGYHGVTKHGVRSQDHAVIYSSKRRGPFYLPGERENGLITLEPIHVELSHTHFKLDELSRLNYANPCAVEHNVKVCFIGRVTKHDKRQLIEYFDRFNGHDESIAMSKGDMNQSLKETNGGYPNQRSDGLGEIYRPKNGAGYVQVTAEDGQKFRDYGGSYEEEYAGDGAGYRSNSH